jgi:hypothetical protein
VPARSRIVDRARAYDATLLAQNDSMNLRVYSMIAMAALIACTGRDTGDAAKTPLPTRQTTIDPVTKKLDTAREDAERRRQQVDDAAK